MAPRHGAPRQESAGVETAAGEADGFIIDWLVGPDRSLGRYRYRLDRTIAKGLEGKPCYVFHATDAPAGCPFSVLVAMDPMPERAALASGGLLSHLHFQYASDDGMLLRADSTLRKRMWNPTMCAAEGTLRDRCDIARPCTSCLRSTARHRLIAGMIARRRALTCHANWLLYSAA